MWNGNGYQRSLKLAKLSGKVFPITEKKKLGDSVLSEEERKPISRIVRVREYHLGLGIILNFYINYSKERGRWPMSAGKNIG